MTIIAEVEAEYGQPFWDVVRGFAADGYGCDTTAGILGYSSPSSFRKLIKRHGVTIDWPKHGSCNVQRERGPLSAERIEKIRRAKLSNPTGIAARYEARHGTPAVTAIRHMARRMTKSEVARAIGWGSAQPLTAWLKVRGESVEFVKRKPLPPKGKGWQKINLGE